MGQIHLKCIAAVNAVSGTSEDSENEDNEEDGIDAEDLNSYNINLIDDLQKLKAHRVVTNSVKEKAEKMLAQKEKIAPFNNIGIPMYTNKSPKEDSKD